MANKGKYKVNDTPCFRATGHVWTKHEDPLVSLCLHCFQPKMVLK